MRPESKKDTEGGGAAAPVLANTSIYHGNTNTDRILKNKSINMESR